MADETVGLDLDPKKILSALLEMSNSSKKLADDIEASLGKKSVKSIGDLENAAEKGTGKITSYFRNLGTRVREDLKTAFDATGILAGAKFAKDLGEGVKQVFEMERAFDRLNTRLNLSSKEMKAFKDSLGSKVAGTGQKLENILPGVETAAAKGGIKSPEQLSAIGEALGQARASTGEETGNLSDTIVEILKSQGQKITADTFKNTLDVLQATRTHGAFHTAGEAGAAIEQISPFAKQMGLGTRELGGLASMAGKSGQGGLNILNQLMSQAAQIGGASKLNAVLEQKIFKEGKEGQAIGMNAGAIGKVNMQSPQIMEAITGLTGASGGDLKRFLESFKNDMTDFNDVVKGSNETSAAFKISTDNLASSIDKFKEKSKEAGREVAGGLTALAHDLMNGDFKKSLDDLKNTGSTLNKNKSVLGADIAITAGIATIAGGGLKNLLSKIPGGGAIGGALGGAVASAAGATPVFVVNMPTEGLGGGIGITSAIGSIGKAGLIGAAALAGYGMGEVINKVAGNEGQGGEWLYNKLHGAGAEEMNSAESKQMAKSTQNYNERTGKNLSVEEFAKAMEIGTLRAHTQIKNSRPIVITNPSKIENRGH